MEKFEQTGQKSEVSEFIDVVNKTDVVVYEKLNASNDKVAKQEFLENPDLIHPNNVYGNLNENEVRKNLDDLIDVEERLKSSWMDDKEKRLVEALIEDNKRKNEFLAANCAYNEAKTDEEKALAAEWHKQANANLYGVPDEDTFYELLGEKVKSIDVDGLTGDDKVVYDRLVANIGPMRSVEGKRFRPSQETVDRFSELINDFYGGFLSHIPDQETFSSEQAVDIINEIIETEIGKDETDYHAVVDEKVGNASASRGIIKFPSETTYSRERLAELVVHELGTHAMRSIPYRGQDMSSFATGLPGSETFDEGIAGCVEQALKGKYEDFGVDHYINISLATFKGKNFREVYEIGKDLKYLTRESDSKVLNNVQRCFRGTGELPNNKDLAYYNGLNRAWQYIEKHIDDPELFDHLFLSGKVAIDDPVHEALSYEMRTGGF